MQKYIHTKHQAAKSNIPNQREELNVNSIKLTKDFDKDVKLYTNKQTPSPRILNIKMIRKNENDDMPEINQRKK